MINNQQDTDKLIQFILTKFNENKLDNNSLVQIIEFTGSLLNLKTISNYAKDNNLSYNGVKNCRCIVEIFKTKFVIDNE